MAILICRPTGILLGSYPGSVANLRRLVRIRPAIRSWRVLIARTVERKKTLDSRIPESATFEVPDVGTVMLAVSNRAKYLRITIKPDRTIRLTVPRKVSYKQAKQFLHSRIPWIEKHLRKFEELENNRQYVRLPRISKAGARSILIERLQELAEMHDFRFNKVSIRNQKTKWGSCSARNNISLNMNLARLPEELRDYVILHELVHTRIKNHNREFWALLDEFVGGRAKDFSRTLKAYRLGV